MKACNMCGTPKALTDFPKQRKTPDGRGDRCNHCQKEYVGERRLKRMPIKKLKQNLKRYREIVARYEAEMARRNAGQVG